MREAWAEHTATLAGPPLRRHSRLVQRHVTRRLAKLLNCTVACARQRVWQGVSADSESFQEAVLGVCLRRRPRELAAAPRPGAHHRAGEVHVAIQAVRFLKATLESVVHVVNNTGVRCETHPHGLQLLFKLCSLVNLGVVHGTGGGRLLCARDVSKRKSRAFARPL